jgi:hypothetical protein
MSLPALAIRLAAAAALSLAAGGLWTWWRKAKAKLRGKRVVILGDKGVGKTHLLTFLTTGAIPSHCLPSGGPRAHSAARFQLRDLRLDVAETWDVSGDKEYYPFWQELIQGSKALGGQRNAVHPNGKKGSPIAPADVVVYLTRADRMMQGDAGPNARIVRDAEHIGAWTRELEVPPRVIVAGTFCDKDPAYADGDEQARSQYLERFRKCAPISRFVLEGGGKSNTTVLAGSLVTEDEAGAFAYRLIEAMGAERV